MRLARISTAAGAAYLASLSRISHVRADTPNENGQDEPLNKTVLSSPMRDSYLIKIGTFESNDSIVMHYDSRTRNSKWVVEHLKSRREPIKGYRKDCRFHQDSNIDVADFRVTNEDYLDTNFDRGHLAAAANWRHNSALMKATFSLANVSPQAGEGFNRDYWARFEAFCRHLTSEFDDVKVCTGPVFAPIKLPSGEWVYAHRTIGQFPRLVTVPTHFFKVVYATKKLANGTTCTAVAAFMVPNKSIDKDMPLEAFAVRLGDLEALTGTRFLFTGLSVEQRDLLDSRWESVPTLRTLAMGEPLEYSLSYGVQRQSDHALLPPKPDIIDVPSQARSQALVRTSRTPSEYCHLCEVVRCTLPKPYAERAKNSLP